MKRYFTIITVLFLAVESSASTFYEQLCSFNPNWKNYKSSVPFEEAKVFYSDRAYIQAHLGAVLSVLQSNPVSHLSEKQYQSRRHLIQVLEGYRLAGNFPLNYYRQERIPVFIDPHNTYCAVGYLMQQSGYQGLAQRIAVTDNYVWVKDLKDAQAIEWQQASGFSMEELKLIQGAYDSYIENAFFLPNKFDIPQKPACIIAYFEHKRFGIEMEHKKENIWCKGEGENGVLNGRWEQNFSVGIPWIEGYYADGKRTGQWKEYYKGTKKLCRTEHWWNDKLNGIRKRFDKTGKLVEEILFRDGKAVTKTNYDLKASLTFVRTPIDSTLVWTEIYNTRGELLATGHEKIYNPGNLLWFQNIELTALNSVAITAKSASINIPTEMNNGLGNLGVQIRGQLRGQIGLNLYNEPALVQYKKEGEWTYYKEYAVPGAAPAVGMGRQEGSTNTAQEPFTRYYRYFGETLHNAAILKNEELRSDYDSIRIVYENDNIRNFYGFGSVFYTPFEIQGTKDHAQVKLNNNHKNSKLSLKAGEKDQNEKKENSALKEDEKRLKKRALTPWKEQKKISFAAAYGGAGKAVKWFTYGYIVRFFTKPREINVIK